MSRESGRELVELDSAQPRQQQVVQRLDIPTTRELPPIEVESAILLGRPAETPHVDGRPKAMEDRWDAVWIRLVDARLGLCSPSTLRLSETRPSLTVEEARRPRELVRVHRNRTSERIRAEKTSLVARSCDSTSHVRATN